FPAPTSSTLAGMASRFVGTATSGPSAFGSNAASTSSPVMSPFPNNSSGVPGGFSETASLAGFLLFAPSFSDPLPDFAGPDFAGSDFAPAFLRVSAGGFPAAAGSGGGGEATAVGGFAAFGVSGGAAS